MQIRHGLAGSKDIESELEGEMLLFFCSFVELPDDDEKNDHRLNTVEIRFHQA